ncbi:MAG: 2-hydroxyacyl-CoA dehydratase [Elusimicrobiota bacterium]|nr:2-hydroxyacyl-CoA dehydratase [Elusimicrobiota bacterium]
MSGKLEAALARCRELTEDMSYASVRSHKEKTGDGAIGYFPVYSPLELYHAAGYLPVAVHGGGNQIEITAADSRFGSFICSIVKSTMELGMKGHLDVLDGVVFHDICDSARNLAWLFERNFKDKLFMEYFHLPQKPDGAAAAAFLGGEYERIYTKLAALRGRKPDLDAIRKSIGLYNINRGLHRRLYKLRSERPQDVLTAELSLLTRAGGILPVEEHNKMLADCLADFEARSNKPRDGIRVLVEGSFCEQPPIELLELLDAVGCFAVDDDLLIGRRWFDQDVPVKGNPFSALAEAYMKSPVPSSVRHNPGVPRTEAMVQRVRSNKAQAVLFIYAKFCEPGLFDYVLFKDVLEREGIPHLLIEFEEKMWTFDKARMELETFVESQLFAYD